ncbi:MAG: hypothetical protein KME27_30205 [Lyngbya sp. HA4199-MV5]|jgi:hypothetical protein|nr:hypothetical protein [Lyngbya sp. HA4199-MV5]
MRHRIQTETTELIKQLVIAVSKQGENRLSVSFTQFGAQIWFNLSGDRGLALR